MRDECRTSEAKMTVVYFEYDPWRGGFCLRLGACSGGSTAAFRGMVTLRHDEQGRIAVIESLFDHGGLPLRGLHGAKNHPEGEYPVTMGRIDVDPLQLRQSEKRLELWFSTGNVLPRGHWERWDEGGVTLWLSSRTAQAGRPVPELGGRADFPLVAGLAIDFSRVVASYPITRWVLAVEDFK
jgi:hypothetical protein